MFEKIKSAYTRRILRRDLQESTDRRQAGVDAQIKVIQNAKQKIIAELAKIMGELNKRHAEQGQFHIALASFSNNFFKLIKREAVGLRELERAITTNTGPSTGRIEGAKLQFNNLQQAERQYARFTGDMRKTAASLERITEKDEQYVMEHIFKIEYIRLLLAYFAYLTKMELKLRNTSNKLDRQELKDINAETSGTKTVTEGLAKAGEDAAKSG